MCAQIAAVNLFQVDLEKSLSYLWNLLCQGTCAPYSSPFKGQGGGALEMHPRSGVRKQLENDKSAFGSDALD